MTVDASHESFRADYRPRHSDFQMDYLITVRNGGTPYGCYKQALRELFSRADALEALRKQEAALLPAEIPRALRESLDNTEYEYNRFLMQAEELRRIIGPLTPERHEQLDREMWQHKFKVMAAIDLITNGRLTSSTCETIAALPQDMRQQIFADLRSPQRLIEWFENTEPPLLEATTQ